MYIWFELSAVRGEKLCPGRWCDNGRFLIIPQIRQNDERVYPKRSGAIAAYQRALEWTKMNNVTKLLFHTLSNTQKINGIILIGWIFMIPLANSCCGVSHCWMASIYGSIGRYSRQESHIFASSVWSFFSFNYGRAAWYRKPTLREAIISGHELYLTITASFVHAANALSIPIRAILRYQKQQHVARLWSCATLNSIYNIIHICISI